MKKKLTIRLIQQDLKHTQLCDGLRRLGLHDNGLHSLNILPLVAELMGISQTSDDWEDVYLSFLKKASDYPVSDLGTELMALAGECYEGLVAFGKT